MSFHLVLVEPEIPANTGNIARTCAGTGAFLHLVRPLGFRTDDATLKRAGLDYWHSVKLHYWDSFDELAASYPESRMFLASTRAKESYTRFEYREGDMFVFGKETAGLPQALLERYPDTLIRIPISDQIRSLNLANSAAIILFEALRQTHFPGLR